MNIALVAHDSRKKELIEWVEYNYSTLMNHTLYATGTTAKLIKGITKKISVYNKEEDWHIFEDRVVSLLSGPLGGDRQIGAMIAEGKIDILIFFCDNLAVQGHQTDVSALTRLASLYNIAFATNRTTADMIITSPLIREWDRHDYKPVLPTAIENYKNRDIK